MPRYMQVPIRDANKKTGEIRTTYINCEITMRNGVTYAILSDYKVLNIEWRVLLIGRAEQDSKHHTL